MHEDLRNDVPGAIDIPSESEGMEAVISALEKNVHAMIKADRKVTALKELQVCGSAQFNLSPLAHGSLMSLFSAEHTLIFKNCKSHFCYCFLT